MPAMSADYDRVDPAEALMREVGAQLRQVRLDRGEDLDEVAKYLRIKPAYLFGIEQGDLSALPGRTYALGFLRTYADYLGFDGTDLTARVKSAVGELPTRTRLRIRTPMPENRLPRTPMLVISLAVVAGIYLGWSYVNRSSRMAMDTVAEVPSDLRERTGSMSAQDNGDVAPVIEGSTSESVAAPEGATAGIGTDQPTDSPSDQSQAVSSATTPTTGSEARGTASAARSAEATPVATGELGGEPAPAPEQATGPAGDALAVQPAAGAERFKSRPAEQGLSNAGDAAAPLVLGTATASAETAGGSAEPRGDTSSLDPARQAVALLLDPATRGVAGVPRVYEVTNTDARVILRAREPTWIQVSSPAGDYTFTRTLEPGEAMLVPNRGDLELWTGNAGGLEIIVDGTSVALPRGGAVRRDVSLDPERLLRLSGPSR